MGRGSKKTPPLSESCPVPDLSPVVISGLVLGPSQVRRINRGYYYLLSLLERRLEGSPTGPESVGDLPEPVCKKCRARNRAPGFMMDMTLPPGERVTVRCFGKIRTTWVTPEMNNKQVT